MAKDDYMYPAVLDCADDGITIFFPDLPGCLSCAQTDEEAYFMARDAMRGWLLVCEEYGREVKEPTPLKDVALADNQRTMLVHVNLAFDREPPHRSRSVTVRKTLTLPAWLNELAKKDNVNFSDVLQNALKQRLKA